MVTSPGSPFPRAVDCASFTPEVLPSGAEPGQSRPYPPEDPEDHQMAWGEGRDLVVLSWGSESVADDLEGIEDHLMLDYDGTQAVAKDGMRRMVVPVGDPPLGGIGIRFAIDGCPYNLTINIEAADDGSGITLTEAISYAEQF